MKNIDSSYIYSIGEVSEILNIKEHTLRFWEKEFPFLKPKRTHNGRRGYAHSDIELLQQIKKLLYDQGYTTKGALKELSEGQNIDIQVDQEALFSSLEKNHAHQKKDSVTQANQNSPAKELFVTSKNTKEQIEKKLNQTIFLQTHLKIVELIQFWEKFDLESDIK